MTAQKILLAAAAAFVGHAAQAAALESTSATTTYHRAIVDGVGIFYREAGPKDAPTIVLLHGFPSSSREFDTLIPLLATRYHLIAPDFPGFGQSDAPPPSSYAYTFDHLAETTSGLLAQLNVNKCSFFLHDYGGPVGFRMMLAHPERVQALIVQNANAYQEGLGAKWTAIAQYWADPKAHPDVFDAFVSKAATEARHTLGTSHPERYNPDTWTDEFAHLSRPGQREIQAALLYDYRTNVAVISGVAGLAAPAQAADPGGLGPQRSLVHRRRGRGLRARPAGRRNPSARRRSFCAGREERRDRAPHSRIHGEAAGLTTSGASCPGNDRGKWRPEAGRSHIPPCGSCVESAIRYRRRSAASRPMSNATTLVS